jgi:hypothetical protein
LYFNLLFTDENITFVFAEKWPFHEAVREFQLLGRVQVNAGAGGAGLSRADVNVKNFVTDEGVN